MNVILVFLRASFSARGVREASPVPPPTIMAFGAFVSV